MTISLLLYYHSIVDDMAIHIHKVKWFGREVNDQASLPHDRHK
jgi:hypothetical protein